MATNIAIPAGSSAAAPDLDWSQVRETIRMLNLAVAQIEFCMREGDDSILALTDSFTAMAGGIQSIQQLLAEIPAAAPALEKCQDLSAKVHAAIIAFQFYDKLSQKLGHVATGVAGLGDLVGCKSRLYDPREWLRLQQQIRAAYTVENERELFDALMRGTPIEEALALAKASRPPAENDGVELF